MTDEQVLAVLRKVVHPEMKRDLVELGMIKDVAVEDSQVTITLALPFMNVPIKEDLVDRVKEVLSSADPAAQVEVELVEMGQKERAAFMGQAEGGPGPATAANEIAHVVAVLSGKGGVGKSSVAALLAVALRRREMRVGVLDADITGPSIPRMFGLHQRPRTSPLGILPVETGTGIKVMSINLLLSDEDQAVIWRGPLISSAIKQFWTEVAWGKLDVLVVDLPPGTSDASLTECGKKILVFGPSQAMQTAALLRVPLLGQLPLDAELACRCDAGEIEEYGATSFEPIVKPLVDRMRVVCPL